MSRKICPFAIGFTEQDLTCGATAYIKSPTNNFLEKMRNFFMKYKDCDNCYEYENCKYYPPNREITIKNGVIVKS